MAASKGDVQTLARKLRGKGLDDDQVAEGLRGMGFSKADAADAVAATRPAPAAPAAPAATKPGGKSTGGAPSTPQTPPGASAAPVGLPTFPKPDLSQVTLTPPKRLSGGDVGGFLAGLALYALVLNYIRYGVDGPKGWLSAKFLNRPAWLGEGIEGSSGATLDGGSGALVSGLTTTRPTITGTL